MASKPTPYTPRHARGPEYLQPANTERDEREKHEMRLFRCMQTARPVYLKTNGRQRFIQCITTCMSGGSYDMDIYLAGDPTMYRPDDLIYKDEPK
jgi:hypothetical protein